MRLAYKTMATLAALSGLTGCDKEEALSAMRFEKSPFENNQTPARVIGTSYQGTA